MPVALPNTTTAAAYPAAGQGGAQIGGTDIFETGWFTVANNAVICEYIYGIQGQLKFSPEFFLAPGTYPIAGNPINPISGIRFRDAIAGTHAQVWGGFFYKNDPVLASSSEFTAIVSPTGGTSGGTVGEIAFAPINASINSTLVAEANAVVIASTQSISFDGVTKYRFEFFSPAIFSGGALGDVISVDAWTQAVVSTGIELGRIIGIYGASGSYVDAVSAYGIIETIPPAGNYPCSARLWSSGHAGSVLAGPGGAIQNPQSFFRISSA